MCWYGQLIRGLFYDKVGPRTLMRHDEGRWLVPGCMCVACKLRGVREVGRGAGVDKDSWPLATLDRDAQCWMHTVQPISRRVSAKLSIVSLPCLELKTIKVCIDRTGPLCRPVLSVRGPDKARKDNSRASSTVKWESFMMHSPLRPSPGGPLSPRNGWFDGVVVNVFVTRLFYEWSCEHYTNLSLVASYDTLCSIPAGDSPHLQGRKRQ